MKRLAKRFIFFAITLAQGTVFAAQPVTTLPENRFLHFNDYALTNAPNPVWVHEGPVAAGLGNSPKALLPGTNHWHRTGWVFRSCRTGTSGALSGGPRIIPPVTPIPTYPLASSNLAANLRNDLNALIESPVFANGIGTVYFEAINSLQPYPTQISVDIATGMVFVASGTYTNTVALPPVSNGVEYVWETMDVLDLAAATSNDFTRYSRRLNARGSAKLRIRRTGTVYPAAPDAYYTVIDNLRVSPPPSDVRVYKNETVFDPGYPSTGTNFSVRCYIDDVDASVPTDARTAQVIYRWRFLNQVIQPWRTNTLSYVAGTGDGQGNGERYEAVLPTFADAGDLEYFFTCAFDGYRYQSPDYTGLGYSYGSETVSPSDLRGGSAEPDGRDFFIRLRPYPSAYGALYVVADQFVQPIQMALVGDDEWRGMVPVRGTSVTNISWCFKGVGLYVRGADTYSTYPAYWAEQVPPGIGRLPYGGVCVPCNETARINAPAPDCGYIQIVFNTRTLEYRLSRAEYQNFNAWPAPENVFSDSSSQGPRQRFLNTFEGWPTDAAMTYQESISGYLSATNIYSYAPFVTPQQWVAGSAAYVGERPFDWANPTPGVAVRNSALRLKGGAGGLGLGYVHNSAATLTDGLKEFTFRCRLGKTASNVDVAYHRYGFTNINYAVRANAVALANGMSPENPSVSLVGYYQDMDNFYEYRIVQINDIRDDLVMVYDRRVRHELYQWVNGVASRLAYAEGSDIKIDISTAIELRFYNVSGSQTLIKCRYGSLDRIIYTDSVAPVLQSGTFGVLSSECKSGFSAISLFPTDTSANIPTGATATEVLGTMETSFTSQAANWFAPAGRFALTGSVTPKGLYSVAPNQQIGVYVQNTAYGIPGEPAAPGTPGWQLLQAVTVANYSYQAVAVPIQSWQSKFVMLQVMGGTADVAVDDMAVSSWHGMQTGLGNVDPYEWLATEAWVVSNAAAEAHVVQLDQSRADPATEQTLGSPLIETGLGLMEFDYRVLRGPAKLTVQYALKRAPSEWIDVSSFVTNTVTGWTHATAYLGKDESGYFRVLNARGGVYSNALVEINNAAISDEPYVDGTMWKAYNAKITATDTNRVALDESKALFLNNSQTLEAVPPQVAFEPYLMSPELPRGLGHVSFLARAYTSNQAATLYLYASTNGWNAQEDLWFEIARFENMTNGLYKLFSFAPEDGHAYDAVKLGTLSYGSSRRVCIEEVVLSEPIIPGFDIVNVRVLCSEYGGAYSTNRFQPLLSDEVGVEAQLANLSFAPSNIQMFISYYVGTNVWGVDNWPAGQTVTKPMFPDSGNPALYRTSTDDDMPAQGPEQVVQYRVWASYLGGVPLQTAQATFEMPSWYASSEDLNQAYAAQGWSPYYLVYWVQTETQTTPVSVPFVWLDGYPTLLSRRGGDYEAAAWLDVDGDGRKTWEEYVAGTVPTNGESVFRTLLTVGDVGPQVTWTPDLGEARVYTVEGKNSLTDGVWGPTNAASRFFRVKVQMP